MCLANGLMNGDELDPVGKGGLDLDVVDHFGDAFHDLVARDHMGAGFHEIGDGASVARALDDEIGNQGNGFGDG
jgi:hypothetical protein